MADFNPPLPAKVKWFQGSFGFLAGADGQDYFVHHTAIVVDDRTEVRGGQPFRTLSELQDVEILSAVHNGDKGWKATKVRKL